MTATLETPNGALNPSADKAVEIERLTARLDEIAGDAEEALQVLRAARVALVEGTVKSDAVTQAQASHTAIEGARDDLDKQIAALHKELAAMREGEKRAATVARLAAAARECAQACADRDAQIVELSREIKSLASPIIESQERAKAAQAEFSNALSGVCPFALFMDIPVSTSQNPEQLEAAHTLIREVGAEVDLSPVVFDGQPELMLRKTHLQTIVMRTRKTSENGAPDPYLYMARTLFQGFLLARSRASK
jgi:hypothetical protein